MMYANIFSSVASLRIIILFAAAHKMLKLTTELLFFYFKNKYGQKICIIKHGNRQD